MTVLGEPFDGYQHRHSYRLRVEEDEEGALVERIRVRALMIPPGIPEFATRERVVRAGPCVIEGRAWSGEGEVEGVEVSDDGGETWAEAELLPDTLGRWAWRAWRFDWDARPGERELCCRARDVAGSVQPLEAAWNLGGYANNAVQRVPVTVSLALSCAYRVGVLARAVARRSHRSPWRPSASRRAGTDVARAISCSTAESSGPSSRSPTTRAREGSCSGSARPRDGMLFVFPEGTTGGFWMKNTLVPLAIVFFDCDGRARAAALDEAVREDPCPIYDPRRRYRFALELPAGTSGRPCGSGPGAGAAAAHRAVELGTIGA